MTSRAAAVFTIASSRNNHKVSALAVLTHDQDGTVTRITRRNHRGVPRASQTWPLSNHLDFASTYFFLPFSLLGNTQSYYIYKKAYLVLYATRPSRMSTCCVYTL
jgi:hypothetical protein